MREVRGRRHTGEACHQPAQGRPPPNWEVVKEVAQGPFGHLLTGIDFCNREEGYPPKGQRKLFDAVKEFNLQHRERALAILYHVGESFNDKSPESAVRWVHEAAELGAHRLGHAIALGVDPERYGRHTRTESAAERMDQLRYDLRHREGLANFGVTVDTADAEEELDRIGALAMNHQITIASDDPGIFGVTLADEIAWVTEHHRLSEEMAEHIVDLSWSSRSEALTGRSS